MARSPRPISTCDDCGRTRCLTYIISIQGGTRQRSVAASPRRTHRCRECVDAQIERLDRPDRAARPPGSSGSTAGIERLDRRDRAVGFTP